MVRPKKQRYVGKEPIIDYFKPRGIPIRDLEEINLTKEEYEALRLKEIENYSQVKCSELMNVSQPTYSRVLDSARKKITDAIVNGKALKIEGGVFKLVKRKFKCFDCKSEWMIAFGTGRPNSCPKCEGLDIQRVSLEKISV
ncbi:DUF134 domain-containing protein [archaeon]|jgi:uncharacterized protein|nr:DUF134 domain-containing protein [archaeon]MBT4647901.1 DUF134 domain-containing protein [archaeon]MBT7393135.1 DUF134 domain-containing protein [archaeon]